MNIRRAAAVSAVAAALLLPGQAAFGQGSYPPEPPEGVSPSVSPSTPPSDVSAGSDLPRTGAGIAAAGGAGALLLGGGAALVVASRRRGANNS